MRGFCLYFPAYSCIALLYLKFVFLFSLVAVISGLFFVPFSPPIRIGRFLAVVGVEAGGGGVILLSDDGWLRGHSLPKVQSRGLQFLVCSLVIKD